MTTSLEDLPTRGVRSIAGRLSPLHSAASDSSLSTSLSPLGGTFRLLILPDEVLVEANAPILPGSPANLVNRRSVSYPYEQAPM